jgi:uncharacterized protein YukE
MDIDDVRSFAQQLVAKAEEIENAKNALTSLVHTVNWVGHDAARFIGEWESSHAPLVQSVVEALRAASTDALTNAAAQEAASAI